MSKVRECTAQRKSRVPRLDVEASAKQMLAVPVIVLLHFSNSADILMVGKTAISLLNLASCFEPDLPLMLSAHKGVKLIDFTP